jgi:anti-anti-sigma factor
VNDLTIHARTAPSGPVLELTGGLDHDTSPQVRAHLLHLSLLPGQLLVVDLGAVAFCDSSGISALIAARNHALQAGASIALAAVPSRIDRIFHVVGLEAVFPTHPTAQAATDAWTPPTF